jgi:hypothetical protein
MASLECSGCAIAGGKRKSTRHVQIQRKVCLNQHPGPSPACCRFNSSGAADASGGVEENGHAEGKQEEAQPLRDGLRSRGVEAEALARGYTEQDTEEPQEEAGFSGRER